MSTYAGFSAASRAAVQAARGEKSAASAASDAAWNWLPRMGSSLPFGLIGGTMAGGLAGEYFWNRIAKALDQTPRAKKQQLKKILRHANLSKMPAIPIPMLQNAFYGDPELWSDPNNYHEEIDALRSYFKKNPKALARARQYGLIGYDPSFGTQGILAHEAGHAHIRNRPDSSWARFNQSVLRPWGNWANSAALPVGVVAGALSGNPVVGAGVGGLVGALTGGPTLVNEAQATRHAYRYADENITSPREKKLTRKALDNAWGTYAGGALVPGLAGGAVAGALAYNPKAWQHLKELAGEAGKSLSNTLGW